MRFLEKTMQKHELTNEEKKQLSYQRQTAVRLAWRCEKNRVQEGYGTRNWSASEQEELISEGVVHGYEGHHMKSVSLFPEYAGDPKNIQFLSETEHLWGAHNGNYHTPTNGYYDPMTGIMHDFKGAELPELNEYPLNEARQQQSIIREDCSENGVTNDNDTTTDSTSELINQQRESLMREYSTMDTHKESDTVPQLQEKASDSVSFNNQEETSTTQGRAAKR